MRFALSLSDGPAAVLDVSLREGSSPELRLVRVTIGGAGGADRFAFEFASREGEAWRSSLRRVLRASAKDGPVPESTPEQQRT